MAETRDRLDVQERRAAGSAEARRLRRQGLVPGVLYGGGGEARSFAVSARELRRALGGEHGMNAILDVVIGSESKPHHVVLKDYQLDPKRSHVVHVDFHEVRLDRPIQAQVAVELLGTPEGVTTGGVLSQIVREIAVEALPMEMPDRLELDVSSLQVGDSVRVGDISAPAGVTIIEDEEVVLASVLAPTRIEEPEVAVEEEAELEEGEVPEVEAEGQAAPGTPEAGEEPAES